MIDAAVLERGGRPKDFLKKYKVGMRPVGSYEDDEVGEVLIYETVRDA